jgi:hypothetical protein
MIQLKVLSSMIFGQLQCNYLILVITLHFNCRAAKEQKKAVKAAKKVQAPPKVMSVY